MEITGTYDGFYEYGPGYLLPEFGKCVQFQVEITEENGTITGKVKEEESEFSVHHPAEIKGHIEDRSIFFIKNYLPKTVDIEEIIDSAPLGQANLEPIDHAGYIDHENKCLYGDWTIEIYIEREDGTREKEPYFLRGIWFLSRSSS